MSVVVSDTRLYRAAKWLGYGFRSLTLDCAKRYSGQIVVIGFTTTDYAVRYRGYSVGVRYPTLDYAARYRLGQSVGVTFPILDYAERCRCQSVYVRSSTLDCA